MMLAVLILLQRIKIFYDLVNLGMLRFCHSIDCLFNQPILSLLFVLQDQIVYYICSRYAGFLIDHTDYNYPRAETTQNGHFPMQYCDKELHLISIFVFVDTKQLLKNT